MHFYVRLLSSITSTTATQQNTCIEVQSGITRQDAPRLAGYHVFSATQYKGTFDLTKLLFLYFLLTVLEQWCTSPTASI